MNRFFLLFSIFEESLNLKGLRFQIEVLESQNPLRLQNETLKKGRGNAAMEILLDEKAAQRKWGDRERIVVKKARRPVARPGLASLAIEDERAFLKMIIARGVTAESEEDEEEDL